MKLGNGNKDMNELHLRKQYLSCIKTFFTLAILFFVLILFTSCNPDINSPVDVQDISLSNTDINLNVGETATVYATIYPFDATYSEISWNSSNPNVASVEHGYIKAISTGETIISAHAGSALAICRVIVTEELNDIRISDSTCWLKSGEKYQLTYSVKPDNYEKNDINWSSKETSIAEVDHNGVVTAKESGTTTIKLTIDGQIAYCEINVLPSLNENGSFILDSAVDLMVWAKYVNAGNLNANAILMADIILNDDTNWTQWDENSDIPSWTPIGIDAKNAFNGKFDGNGYSIRGLYVTVYSQKPYDPFDNNNFAGLFGYVGSNGEICNLEICSGYVYCKGGYSYAGGIAGEVNGGTISNCYNSANIFSETINSSSFNAYAAGIVGYCYDGLIEKCSSTSNAIIQSGEAAYYSIAAGIVGNSGGKSIIQQCSNYSTIISTGRYSEVGGIAGSVSGTLSNCYNSGTLKFIKSADAGSVYASIGGISGYAGGGGSITRSYNVGQIICSSTTQEDTVNVGGILGRRNYDGSCGSSYFLETTADKLIGDSYSTTPSDYSMTSHDIKSEKFVGRLNSLTGSRVWQSDSTNKNNGYPVLVCESEIVWN